MRRLGPGSPKGAGVTCSFQAVPEPTQIRFRAWEKLFANGGVAQCLPAKESRKCRSVCRDWRRLAGSGVCEEDLWNGQPSDTRGSVWRLMLLGGIILHDRAGTNQERYESLCEKESPFDSAIRRDVNRTLPQEELFSERTGVGQVALFRLLRALAIRLSDIGYCQGLNFVVATLIGIFPGDEATVFQCAVALLLRYSLIDLYRPKFAKLGVVVWQFDRIVEGFLPQVHIALVRHGVNSEYYAIQWFLTLYSSDLGQEVVRRIWDRFLIVGWRVIVQVGLALLYTIQDTLPTMDICEALTYLRTFASNCNYSAEELLESASSFKVSHRMLSALEAAYGWDDNAELLVVRDLNSGQVHWAVQPVVNNFAVQVDGEADDQDEPPFEVPKALGKKPSGCACGDEVEETAEGEVLPFLLKNLDTGEETVIDEAWTQYTDDMEKKSRASARPAQARPSGGVEPGHGGTSPQGHRGEGGSFWTQSVQRQAARRLAQT